MSGRAMLLLPLAFVAGVQAMSSWHEDAAVWDSLRCLSPNMRFREMHRLGLIDRSPVAPSVDSGGLRLLGKWGAGPSVKVTGRDSIVYLSRGSEVVAINFADTANPEMLSYMQVNGLVSRSVLVGDRLYVGSTGSDPKYIDVFDVADPANPALLGSVQTQLNDIAVQDTLVYAIGDDSLKVYSFADPENPWLVGACQDSGYDIAVCNGYAYLGDRWGLYVVDVRDPASPRRVASWGTFIVSVQVRDSICCVTQSDINGNLTFRVLDTRQPTSIVPLGSLADRGGYDIYLEDSLAFLSGAITGSGYEFQILSIRDSLHPRLVGDASTPGDNWGVWADRAGNRAFVADRNEGMQVFDIADLGSPVRDTALLAAGSSYDVDARGSLMVVANEWCGMKVLGIGQPDNPVELAAVDTTYSYPVMHSVLLADSFAYTGWSPWPYFRAVGIRDPTRPEMAGACAGVNVAPEDMVLCDSLVYIAGMRRFNVVNVVRPREPVLVGSCVLSGYAGDLDVVDTFAYLSHNPLTVVNVARPDNPVIMGTWGGRNHGIDAADTIVYATGPYTGLAALSVANPAAPHVLDSLYLEDWWNDVAVGESLAFVGGTYIKTVDVSNPRALRVVGTWTPPHLVQRIEYVAPYVYAACLDAGVCILETIMTGLAEQSGPRLRPIRLSVRPSVAGAAALLEVCGLRGAANAYLCDAAGRRLVECRLTAVDAKAGWELKLAGLPVGVYLVSIQEGNRRFTTKVVKAR